MTAFFKALISALLEHLTGLVREDKKASDGDKAPEKIREAFADTVRRKYHDGMRSD